MKTLVSEMMSGVLSGMLNCDVMCTAALHIPQVHVASGASPRCHCTISSLSSRHHLCPTGFRHLKGMLLDDYNH